MEIPSEMRNTWLNKRRESLWIASPVEEEKIRRSRECTQEGVRAGAKAAVIACVASAIPTLTAVRTIPWAKANLNYTAQALIISAVGALTGFKAAAIACVASAIPTLAAVRTMPWAKANLNYTAQALIIGGASTAAFFINSEKIILAGKRRNAG